MRPMNDDELPEWLQREQDDAREQEAVDRMKIALATFAIGFAGALALIQIARAGGLG